MTPWTCPECGEPLRRITLDKQIDGGDWLVIEARICTSDLCDYATVGDWWWESNAVHEMGRDDAEADA